MRTIFVVLALGTWLASELAGAADSVRSEPDGRAIYAQACATCHGPNGRGDGPEADSFNPPPRDLRSGLLATADEAQVVARVRDGTPLALAGEPRSLKQRLRHLEDVTKHIQRLPDVDWVRVDEGGAIFAERCAICHGSFGEPLPSSSLPPGVQKPPRDLRDPEYQRATGDAALVAAMQHGRSAMPAIPAIRDEKDAQAVVVFIRLLSPGFETYSYYCAACHGDDGRGNGVLATGKNRPPVVFDRAWRASKDQEQLRIDVAHMLAAQRATMPHFGGTLTDEQLRAIVRYLKSAG